MGFCFDLPYSCVCAFSPSLFVSCLPLHMFSPILRLSLSSITACFFVPIFSAGYLLQHYGRHGMVVIFSRICLFFFPFRPMFLRLVVSL
jgi:hypothetical protein